MRSTKIGPPAGEGCTGQVGRGPDTTVPSGPCVCLGRDIREKGRTVMAGPVKDREAFQRLSFLYQAAHCVLSQNPENQALARFYCHTEKTIAKRLVLRQDPSVKRTLCRGCSSLLIPGLTCTQRQRRHKGQSWTVQTCLTCQRSQRFLNDPKHLLWGDRPEAQLENQADFKPSEPLPNTAHLPKENTQPQASNTNDEFTPFSR